jgi:hypothetical protein
MGELFCCFTSSFLDDWMILTIDNVITVNY